MAVVDFHEIPPSRELTFETPTATRHWVCEGLFSDVDVGNLALTNTPQSITHPLGTLFRKDIQVKEVGFCVYDVEVTYDRENQEIGSYTIEVDTLGGTVNIKAGVHQNVYPSGSPTHQGLIAVKDDDVEGIDITIPACRVIVHFSHPGNYMDLARVRALTRLGGSVDNSGILGWEPFEVLFLGIQYKQTAQFGTMESTQREEVSYHFAMSENRVNFNIGSITGISKKGWDVAWVKWLPAVEGGNASNEADYVNVVRVYREYDLKTLLGFG